MTGDRVVPPVAAISPEEGRPLLRSIRRRQRSRRDRLPAEVVVLSAVAFISACGFGVQSPAIPVFATALGAGSTAVGVLTASFAGMRLLAGPLGGVLLSRASEAVVLVAGLGALALASLAAGMAQSFPQLLVFRASAGLGSGLYTLAALALLLRVTPPEDVARAVGRFRGAFSLGSVVGPVLGAVLLGLSLRLPFVAYSAAVAISCVVGHVALRTRGRPPVEAPRRPARRHVEMRRSTRRRV